MRFDAIVIGAGPAGSTAALTLARAGWSVAIVEKSSFPRRKVCGEFISGSNTLLLKDLGLAGDCLSLAGPEVRRVGIFAGDSVLAAAMPQVSGVPGGSGWGRALGRETLDLILLDKALRQGAHLRQPGSAVGLEREPGGYVCRIEARGANETLRAPVVIAAHGSWEQSGLPTQSASSHGASDMLGFKAHFRQSGLPADLMPLLAFPGGYGGMVHSDAGRVSLSCCIRRDALAACRRTYKAGHAAEAVFAHISQSCLGVRQALAGASLDGRWLAAGPIRPGIRRRYAGGVFLVGNAAGEAHPIVAEGISMAMQSGYLLAELLVARQDAIADGRVRDRIGKAYAAAWRRRFATRIRAAALFANLASRPAPAAALLPVLTRFPAILTLGAQLSGKTKVTASPAHAT